jgi:hypothetical protein
MTVGIFVDLPIRCRTYGANANFFNGETINILLLRSISSARI